MVWWGSGLFGMRYVQRLGRKPTLMVTGALYAAGFGAIATCSSYPALLAGRFLTGLGAGLATVVTPCYIAEISPPNQRGSLASLYQLFCTLGILAAYGLGAVMGWREFAAAAALLSMMVYIDIHRNTYVDVYTDKYIEIYIYCISGAEQKHLKED